MRRTLALACTTGLAFALVAIACGPRNEPPHVPPPTSARPTAASTGDAAAPPGADGAMYSGHGAASVSPEILARFAPTPLPSEVSRRIQAMLDVRAPIASRLAPDGRSLFFAWTVTGTPQIWKADGPRRFPVQLTGGEDVSRLSAITPDGAWLVIARDRKGEENPGLYLMPTNGGAMRVVQHVPNVQTQLQHVTRDGKSLFFRANDVKADSYAIYRWDFAGEKRELVFGEDGLWSMDDLSASGTKLLLAKATGALTREYWEYDLSTRKLVALLGQGEKEEYEAQYGATPGELVVQTPKFGEYRRLYRVKPKGGPLAAGDAVAITPDAPHDVSSFFLDAPRRTLYFTSNEGGFLRGHALDAKTYKERAFPAVKGAVHLTFGAPSWDGRYVIVNATSATAPSTSQVLDWQSQRLTEWVVPSTPEIDTSTFAEATLDHYTARDGTKIPMFVRTPRQCERPRGEPCPVLVRFHGGPESQARPGFHPRAQIFVDAGFVFIEPNVRGSDGYGKTWLHADDGPKRLQVITDIEDAAKHVRVAFASGGKAPKVGIMGGSYGGYSTLVGMTMFAGAYDAGAANVGMSNLLTFLLNTAPYRRALRASEYGDPETDRAALLELSPITHIDKLAAPLLLVQGASDPRVPLGEALQMHAALERRGVTTKMIVFPDEGHGAQKRENQVLEIGHTLAFFEEHLKAKDASARPD
jgi:dipeptidyl aminopeptidase/acylaminoacyl peptidase